MDFFYLTFRNKKGLGSGDLGESGGVEENRV